MPSMRPAGPSGAATPDIRPEAVSRAKVLASDETMARMRDAFLEAGTRTGIESRTFAICGLRVTVRAAGNAMMGAIEPALAHLAVAETGSQDLEVHAWDSATSGVEVPDRIVQPGPSATRSSYQPEPGILTLYDPHGREAVVWVPDARRVPSNEVASPLRVLLHWWARDRGLQFVHAGAVALDGRAVLLAGPSGAGKSTAALAGLAHGLDYLGDDYVVVDGRAGATVHSLYSAGKLQPSQVAAFPELRPMLSNADRLSTEKALWFAHRHFPVQTVASATAICVLVPRVASGFRSSIEKIPRSTALAALAPSTIAQLSGADQWSLGVMASFLGRVDAYRLNAGSDLAGLANTMRELLLASARG